MGDDSTHDVGDLLVTGTTFAGRFKILEHIGSGGMGHVYRAQDTALDEIVALKTVAKALITEEGLRQFRDEVKLARCVTHKNVARVYDIGEHEGVRYLTMELVEGETLRKRLRRPPPLGLQETARVGAELAAGLAAAHDAGIVHRDLKPANVILDKKGLVRIIDFGIAFKMSTDGEDGARRIGTMHYMAPEELMGRASSTPADVYALGLLLFEMAAGQRPFPGVDAKAVARARLAGPAPDLRSLIAVPDALALLVARCLASDPLARPTAAAAEQALRAVQGALADVDESPTIPENWADDAETSPLDLAPRVPTGARAHSLAVLPFRAATEPLTPIAQGLSASLRDLLSMTKGLIVKPVGDGAAELSPRDAGLRAGVDAVVDGEVASDGGHLHVKVRLYDVESGKLSWAHDVDGRMGGLMLIQMRAAQRIAEELRVEIQMHATADVPDEVVETFLRSRAKVRQGLLTDLVADFDEMGSIIQVVPQFAPAHSMRAMAAVRLWMLPRDVSRDWGALARAAVADALVHAPTLPETHLSAAWMAEQEARFKDAVRSLERALSLAPAFGSAHELLGRLQIESGRIKEGVRRLRLAAELDERCAQSLALVERAAIFAGRLDVAERVARRMQAIHMPLEHLMLRMRVGLWSGKFDADHELQQKIQLIPFEPARTVLPYIYDIARGGSPDRLQRFLERREEKAGRSRFTLFGHQVLAEAFARTNRELALRHVELAAEEGLFDLDWMDRCPPIKELENEPRYAIARAIVAERVDMSPQAQPGPMRSQEETQVARQRK